MPTKREREYYGQGYKDGRRSQIVAQQDLARSQKFYGSDDIDFGPRLTTRGSRQKPKRKLSAWQKFVKANSKKPRFVLRSGKLNLKKMGVAYRKTPAGKKSKRR